MQSSRQIAVYSKSKRLFSKIGLRDTSKADFNKNIYSNLLENRTNCSTKTVEHQLKEAYRLLFNSGKDTVSHTADSETEHALVEPFLSKHR